MIPSTVVKYDAKDFFLGLCYYVLEVTGTSVWDVPSSLCCEAFTVLGPGARFYEGTKT